MTKLQEYTALTDCLRALRSAGVEDLDFLLDHMDKVWFGMTDAERHAPSPIALHALADEATKEES